MPGSARLSVDLDVLLHAQIEHSTEPRRYGDAHVGHRDAGPVQETAAWAEYLRQTRLLGYRVEYGEVTTFRKDDKRTIPPRDLR